jgi:hypothetical protein
LNFFSNCGSLKNWIFTYSTKQPSPSLNEWHNYIFKVFNILIFFIFSWVRGARKRGGPVSKRRRADLTSPPLVILFLKALWISWNFQIPKCNLSKILYSSQTKSSNFFFNTAKFQFQKKFQVLWIFNLTYVVHEKLDDHNVLKISMSTSKQKPEREK